MHCSRAQLSIQIAQLMLPDQQRLQRQLSRAEKISDRHAQQLALNAVMAAVSTARLRVLNRLQARPMISYPDDLPLSQQKQAIYDAIAAHQVVIVAGDTGSGKTTQLPKICLELGRGITGIIGHTQPRRLAARTVAARLAQELNSQACIGYKVRFSDSVGETTLVKLMTDGILLAEIQQDRLLMQYDTLIIDEAHERSLNIDFILGYLRNLLPRRPDLKVIITSATIDPQRFSQHFFNAPVIKVSGRTYPVEVRWRPLSKDNAFNDNLSNNNLSNDNESNDNVYNDTLSNGNRDQLQAIIDAVDELGSEGSGDILIFMSGEREIRDATDALNNQNLPHTEVLPLYSRLSNSEQNRVFQAHQGRRILLATNVAETSLTVPGIKYVIDAGSARISRYSSRTKVQRLPIEAISQASANQRKGRCGRTSAGICIRLYSEADFLSRPEFTDPEIVRTSLASVILQMTALGLGDISAFPFITAPDKRHIQDGVRLLQELSALRMAKNGHTYLSAIGHQLAKLPLDPRLGRMVLAAQKTACVRELIIITAALSITDPRERPVDKQQAADEKHRRFVANESDFLAWINLWDYLTGQQAALSSGQFRQLCRGDFLNRVRVREWQDIHAQLHQAVKELGITVNSIPADYRSLHSALLSGLLSRTGQKDREKAEFTGAHSARFAIFPGSALFKKPPQWVMVAELVETSRLWGRMAARVEPEWIEAQAQHLVKRHYSSPHWEKTEGAVMALEKITLFGLTLVPARKIHYATIDPSLCRELFIRHALVEGDWQTRHAFFCTNLATVAEVETLEDKSRRRDILVDDQVLFDFYEQRIGPDVVSARHFDSWWKSVRHASPDLLNFEKSRLFKQGTSKICELDYPDYWYQGEFTLPLSYQFEPGSDADGVTVQIPLAILGQVSEQGFEWQIAGLRSELIIALIKSLPKSLRRHFVPAPDYAQALLASVTPLETGLLDALARELKRITGVTVSQEDWQWEQVPVHLKMTFRIVDDNCVVLKEGKNLAQLRQQLQQQRQASRAIVAEGGIEQSNLSAWSFGTLPACYEQQRAGYRVKTWPALVDEKESVAIRLFETEQAQQRSMWQGTRRLLWLNIPAPIKSLHQQLSNKSKLALCFSFSGFSGIKTLIDDCIACGIDKLMAEQGGLVWQQSDFIRLRDVVRAGLNDTVLQITHLAEQIMTLRFNINQRLKKQPDPSHAMALADITMQLESLVYPGFITAHGWSRLVNIRRYLHAVERRMDQLAAAPQRDREKMLLVQRLQSAWQQRMNKLPLEQLADPEVLEVRWMIEELRVSLFAQQLGTACPISEKRILAAFNK